MNLRALEPVGEDSSTKARSRSALIIISELLTVSLYEICKMSNIRIVVLANVTANYEYTPYL